MSNLKVCKKCKKNYVGAFKGYWPFLEENYNICKECGNSLESINITSDDFWIIWNTSHDLNFIEAMINLHDRDIIEYELKMSQFRNQVEQQKQQIQEQQKSNIPKCPVCGSTDIAPISSGERAMSMIGFGLFSKKINKSFKCNNLKCKYTW